MDRKPTRGFTEEGGRSHLREDDWMRERDLELREKSRRGEELTHEEKMSLAIDEGAQ